MSLKTNIMVAALATSTTAAATSAQSQDTRFGMAEIRAIVAVRAFNDCVKDDAIEQLHIRLLNEWEERTNIVSIHNDVISERLNTRRDAYNAAKEKYFADNGIQDEINRRLEENYYNTGAVWELYYADTRAYEELMTQRFEEEIGIEEPNYDDYTFLEVTLKHPGTIEEYCENTTGLTEDDVSMVHTIIDKYGPEAYFEALEQDVPGLPSMD